VIDPDTTTALAQFGAAGMIGCMWLWERRAASERERQLTEAHDRLSTDRLQLNVLVEALRDNTRALTALESGQRALAGLLSRLEPAEPGRAAHTAITGPRS